MNARQRAGALLFCASALLHVAMLALLLGMLARDRGRQEAPAAAMNVVWIKTPELPAPREQTPPVPVKPRVAVRRTRAMAASITRAPADAVSFEPAAPAAEPLAPAHAAPVFDRQAALASARKLAGEVDPARADTLVARLEARKEPLETKDEKLARTIASGKRTDCVKANGAGSLLTPLMWLLDKKGSGCKL